MRNDAPLKLSDYMTPKPYLRTAMLEPEGLDVFSVDENFDAAELSSRPWHKCGILRGGHDATPIAVVAQTRHDVSAPWRVACNIAPSCTENE